MKSVLSEFYNVSAKPNMFDKLDSLNLPIHVLAKNFSEFFLRHSNATEGTVRNKKILLFNSIYILALNPATLSYETILRYFSDELFFTETNLQIITKDFVQNDSFLRLLVLEILSISYSDLCYLLKEELEELKSFNETTISLFMMVCNQFKEVNSTEEWELFFNSVD